MATRRGAAHKRTKSSFLGLALWPLKDPVALLTGFALVLVAILILVNVAPRSGAHDTVLASLAPVVAMTVHGIAFRRRRQCRRWSVDPPEGSRPKRQLDQLARIGRPTN